MKFEDGKIGMKVRCVDPGCYLAKGVIYTINSFKEFYDEKRFILEEFGEDYIFHPYRFEPVRTVEDRAKGTERLGKVKAMLACVLGELTASDAYAAMDNHSETPTVWQIKNALIREKVMEIMKEFGDD